MQVAYHATNCMNSSLMRMFVRETSAVLAVRSQTPHGILLAREQNDDALAQTPVMALIGRHYTGEFREGQAFFEFDTASQILTARMLSCDYQRSFFVLLLFVSIVLLVFALVMQNLSTKINQEASIKPPAQAHSGDLHTLILVAFAAHSAWSLHCISIDFVPPCEVKIAFIIA